MNRVTDEEKTDRETEKQRERERRGEIEGKKIKRLQPTTKEKGKESKDGNGKKLENVRVLFLPQNIPSFLFFSPFISISFLFYTLHLKLCLEE